MSLFDEAKDLLVELDDLNTLSMDKNERAARIIRDLIADHGRVSRYAFDLNQKLCHAEEDLEALRAGSGSSVVQS